MHANGDWQTVEAVLSKDMATVGEYLQSWKKLSTKKAVLAVFHPNKEAKGELKVNHNNEILPFFSKPTMVLRSNVGQDTRVSPTLEIDRYIGLADICVLPIYRYRPNWPILSASVGVDKTLLYSSRMQTTCARTHKESSQDSYLAAMLAGGFS